MIALAPWVRGLVAAAALAWATPAWSGDIRVGFINPNSPPEFWQLVCATMKASAAQFGIDVEIRESEHSRDKAIAIGKNGRTIDKTRMLVKRYFDIDHVVVS